MDLGRLNKLYEEDEMRRNHEKYKAMVLGKSIENPVFKCDNTVKQWKTKLSYS